MITFGTVYQTLGNSWKNVPREVVEGYYLVLPNGDRHWFALGGDAAAYLLESACEKYLNDKIGYDYWVDYCFGYDVDRKLAWANIDHTDSFI